MVLSLSASRARLGAWPNDAPRTPPPLKSGVLAGLVAAHVFLALVMRGWPLVATVHAYAALIVGVYVATRSRDAAPVACAVAYTVGAEVLWRMTDAGVFWEYGKYAAVVVSLVSIVRRRYYSSATLPLVYVLLLVPAAAVPLLGLPWNESRQAISFNLSGPISLAVGVACFRGVRMSFPQVQRVLTACVGPLAGVLTLALRGSLAGGYEFGRSSIDATSGGFGPNQVSAVLSLGCFLCVLLATGEGSSRMLRVACTSLALLFLTQSALTFSRTGAYLAVGSIVVALVFWLSDLRKGLAPVGLIMVATGLAGLVVYPAVDNVTGGALGRRFSDTSTTGRDRIVRADIEVAMKGRLLGTGLGQAVMARREVMGRRKASHTEYSRLLVEHGCLGVSALVVLGVLAVSYWRSASTVEARVFTVSLMAYALAFMLVSAMRLALPGVLIGLAGISVAAPSKARRGVVLHGVSPLLGPCTASIEAVRKRLRTV